MEPGSAVQLEHILGHVSVGVVILNAEDMCIRYVNPYLRSLLDEPWSYREVVGRCLNEILPAPLFAVADPVLQEVSASGQHVSYAEVPYEGFLERRGRTYWRISIERVLDSSSTTNGRSSYSLFVTIEDVTETVRARLYLSAIYHISSVLAGPTALPQVLERILQALREMVGATRCAVLLADLSSREGYIPDYEMSSGASVEQVHTAWIAAQRGLHPDSQNWRPVITDHLLLGRVGRAARALIIPDTSQEPGVVLPFLNVEGLAVRPGSVLCVPIFEPYAATGNTSGKGTAVLGTIEVYHRRTRGYPAEEVQLLERFAQQVGLAIHNARLFRKVDQLARTANRQAHQKENMMQAIPDGVVIYDPRWRVADANSAARKLFGWTDDILGKPIMQALAQSTSTLHADFMAVPDLVPELERRALAGQVDELRVINAEGQAITLRCSYTPVSDDTGDIFAFIIVYHDITEEVAARERIEAQVIARTTELAQRNQALQQAQAALELTSARMSVLLERLPSGVILVMAKDDTIAIINHRAVQLLQRLGAPLEPLDDPEEASRRSIGLSSDSMFRSIVTYNASGTLVSYEERPLNRALHRGEASEAELHATTRDGRVLYLLINAAPLRAADGTVTSAVLVMHDISKTKALERAREDFFTTMAHELKTPLANIRAHLSALLARDLHWSAEEQYDYLQTADEQVERLVGMVNHFLDASRVEAGALRLEREPILLPEMLEDLQDRLEALIASSQRRLKIVLPPEVPAVLGDYELIISVLTNLLSNAFRYAPEGDTVLLGAEIVYNDTGKVPVGVTLSVTDRGPGMTLEQQTEVFTRFSTFAAMSRPSVDRPGQPAVERRRGTTRWSPATGLGLYISRGIIEAHGSRLILKSAPGQGATFAFTLPIYGGQENR
jgi:PAS domain S-box-containing protein